ncbi:MAG: hypothetical protein M0Z63_11125 [Actinomycetota bacterium]|nr:hypothetical protein [Actinomycetota bacterium]
MLLIGGVPFDEEVLMWWNFVARTRAEILEAHRAWIAADDRFGSARTTSASTSTLERSPVPQATPVPSTPPRTARGSPTSLRSAPAARCGPRAPPRRRGAPSRSTPVRSSSRLTRPHSATPHGRRSTPAPGPRWSARSPTSCAARGEDEEPGSGARPPLAAQAVGGAVDFPDGALEAVQASMAPVRG